MNSRRRLSIISLLVVASVFFALLVSCGIPEYIVPTVDPAYPISSGNNETVFKVTYECDKSLNADDHVGLLLLYYVGESTTSLDSRIISKFKSQYMISSYDGRAVGVEKNEPVFSITKDSTDGGDGDVYAFTKKGSIVFAPDYTFLMDDAVQNSVATYYVKLSYSDESVTCSIYNVDITLPAYSGTAPVDSFSLGFHDDFSGADTTIRVYSAVCVSSTFSNLYWSALEFAGAIKTT